MKANAINILRISGLILGVLLMCAGIVSGELTAIFRKAAVVCLECIGIG